jgi:hypothetical protein
MRTQVRFRTSLFRQMDKHSEQSENGLELAQWLCSSLPARFMADTMDEDWGQRIVLGDPQLNARASLCCAWVEEDCWSCVAEPRRSLVESLLGRPLPIAELETVVRALDSLIAATPAFVEVEWFENDKRHREFNHAARAFAPTE